MASGNKRIVYLGMDYSGFTGGVSECNRKMQLLDSEFKLATEQAKNYGTESDKLGVKSDYLKQKIALQTQKVEEAKKAYDSAMSSSKSSQKEIDNADKKLLDARTTLEKLKGKLNAVDEEIQNSEKSTKSFGDSIRGMTSTLGLEVSPQLENIAKKFDGISADVGNAIIGIGAIATAFAKCSIDAANFADDLLTLSSTTGIATDELQKMEYASKFLDVEVDTMTDSITKLTRNMYSARSGSSDLNEAFAKLHVKITDSYNQLRDANTVFYETIDALGKIKNETERDALAMTVLGKSAKDLNPLIEAGSERLKELGIEAENMGTVMDQESLDKLGRMKDAMDKLENTTDALKNSLGLALLPILTALFEAIGKIPTPVLGTLVVLASAIASILLVVKAIKSLTDTGKTIKNFFTGIDASTLKTTAIILGVVAALIALGTIISVIAGKGNQLSTAMKDVGTSVSSITSTVSSAQNSVQQTQYHASGTTNFSGGRTWVGEAGPEIVELPKGSKIYSNEESNAMARNTSNYYNITIDAQNVREFNDIIRIVKGQTIQERRA